MLQVKKLCFLLAISLLAGNAHAQSSDLLPKLSPLTKKYLKDHKAAQSGSLPEGYIYKKSANGGMYVSAVVKVDRPELVEPTLKSIGATIGTKAGNIWTIQVPVDKVNEFIKITGINYIQLDEPVFPNLDVARKTTKVDSVHGGYNLPYPFTGRDVVVGVIDFGFDYNHPSMYDTLGTKFRIKKVWELGTTGTPPAGYNYGHEITDTNLIKAQGTDNAEQTHGTAVAGMAAGSGFGGVPNNRFRGMAYDANMVLVSVRRDSIGGQWMSSGFSDFIDGVKYIFDYAGSISRPAVVNISWGSHSGPHDGTSLFNQACNNLSGPGKIIVMSAGNEGGNNLHLAKTFTATDTVVNSFVTFNPSNYKRTWVDVWGDAGKTFCAQVSLYNGMTAGNTTGFFCIDDQIHDTFIISSNGLDTCFVQFITAASEFNGKPRTIINLFNKTGDNALISVSGKSGAVNMWDEYYYYGYTYKYNSVFEKLGLPIAVNGNNATTVSDMGSAQSVLLVGAYASKIEFTNIKNNKLSYTGYVDAGKIAPFSSRGPYIDGRIKPDIAAPGFTVATSMSSYDTAFTETGSSSNTTIAAYTHPTLGKKFYYAEFTGTSASAPAASGIVALMLQANPKLTPAQVQTIVGETAIKDNFTGALTAQGNNTWGKGKINGYAAVKRALQENGVYDFKGNKPDVVLYPNPSTGIFILDYTAEKAETVKVQVVSITGAVLYSMKWTVNAGNNAEQLDLSQFAKGNYIVTITNAQGSASIKTELQ